MPQKLLIILALFWTMSAAASAEMFLFTGEECPHCQELKKELNARNWFEKFEIKEYEIYHNEENARLYLETAKSLDYRNGGVPLLVDGKKYVEGTSPIMHYLTTSNPQEMPHTLTPAEQATLKSIISTLEEAETYAIPWVPILITAGLMTIGYLGYRRGMRKTKS